MFEKRKYIFGILIISCVLLFTGCSVRKNVRNKEVKEFAKSILESNKKVKDLSFYFIRPYLGGELVYDGDLDKQDFQSLIDEFNEKIDIEFMQRIGNKYWGVGLNTKNITSTGLTLTCYQSGGEPTGELSTDSYYFLEEKVNNEWAPIEMLPSEHERAWTDEAWIILMNDEVEWEVNWKDLYGELPAGYYRIGKNIRDFRDTSDYDEEVYYANFEVLN